MFVAGALISLSLLLAIKGGETSTIQTVWAFIFCEFYGLCGKCMDVGGANCYYEMIHIDIMRVRATCAKFFLPIAVNNIGIEHV